MERATAVKIFKDIYGDADIEDKLTAIQEVTQLDSVNDIKKNDMMSVLTWLVEEYI